MNVGNGSKSGVGTKKALHAGMGTGGDGVQGVESEKRGEVEV